jgi:hypothetical protein
MLVPSFRSEAIGILPVIFYAIGDIITSAIKHVNSPILRLRVARWRGIKGVDIFKAVIYS